MYYIHVYIISHNYAKIKLGSHSSLPLEKTITSHNVIIKSVWNEDKNKYYYNTFLEKSFIWYELHTK